MEAIEDNNTIPPACQGCVARDRKIAEFEARLAALEALARAGKRQAAPFSKGSPKAEQKRPGRKPGDDYGTHHRRAIPERIDEVCEAPLPPSCPFCDGEVRETKVEVQYQAEIPREPTYRQFNVHIGECSGCKKRVQGRHPLQTSDALGAAASQIGPDAQALSVLLNKDAGLSHGKVRTFFKQAFGLSIARATPCRVMLRAAGRCREAQQVIVKRVQDSPTLVPDETGWRIGGLLAWLHVAVGTDATAYLIDRRRGYEAAVKLIGEDYAGTMTHDGWAPYNGFLKAVHQTCIGHLLRRCHEMLERMTGFAAAFPREVKAVLKDALAVRDQRDAALQTAARIAPRIAPRIAAQTVARIASQTADELARLTGRMDVILHPRRANPDNRRLSKHLRNHRDELFVFLTHPGVDATNHRAEQAIRPAVVNRKVWGGNRTEAGAEAQSILMSVLVTAKQRGSDALAFVSRTLRSLPGHRPSLFPDTG